jgi:hypothetical protein
MTVLPPVSDDMALYINTTHTVSHPGYEEQESLRADIIVFASLPPDIDLLGS